MPLTPANRWRVHCVVTRPDGRALLLVPSSSGWALPVIESAPLHPGDAQTLIAELEQRIGCRVRILGCLAQTFDEQTGVAEWVREFETTGADPETSALPPPSPVRAALAGPGSEAVATATSLGVAAPETIAVDAGESSATVTAGDIDAPETAGLRGAGGPATSGLLSSDAAPPAPARWIGVEALRSVALARSDHQRLVDDWVASGPTPVTTGPPWMARGWLQETVRWAEAELIAAGLGRVDTVDQVRVWEFSSVLRLTAGPRRFYLKALAGTLRRELGLTASLARTHPECIAPIVALDHDRGFILSAAAEGPTLDTVQTLAAWLEAVRACARVQMSWVGRGDELVAMGLTERGLHRLPAALDACLADERAMWRGRSLGLSDDEIVALRDARPRFEAMSRELASGPIPASLEHGDLWAGNVIATERGPVLLDWEDACLAHPFFSAWLLIMSAEDLALQRDEVRASLRDAYLEAWTALAPMPELVRMYQLASALAPLQYATTFHEEVLPVLGPSWELGAFVPFFLRLGLGG